MNVVSEIILMNFPAYLCLIVGFALVVLEMFIPGFGAPGIIGTILLIAGIWLRARTPLEAFVMVIVIVALLCVALSISIRSASNGRLARSKLILREVALPEKQPEIDEMDLDYFVGRTGVTRTALRPAGIGEFEGVRLNVVSEGSFIDRDMPVCVERVEGNRIVVSAQGGRNEG